MQDPKFSIELTFKEAVIITMALDRIDTDIKISSNYINVDIKKLLNKISEAGKGYTMSISEMVNSCRECAALNIKCKHQ